MDIPLYIPDPNKSDPDKDGLPGTSSSFWIHGLKKIEDLPEKEQEIVRSLLKTCNLLNERVAKLKSEFGESFIDVLFWQAYGLIFEYAAKLKLAKPYLEAKNEKWICYLIDAFVWAVDWQAKRIKIK